MDCVTTHKNALTFLFSDLQIKYWQPAILLLVSNARSQCALMRFLNDLKRGGLYTLGHIALMSPDASRSHPTTPDFIPAATQLHPATPSGVLPRQGGVSFRQNTATLQSTALAMGAVLERGSGSSANFAKT